MLGAGLQLALFFYPTSGRSTLSRPISRHTMLGNGRGSSLKESVAWWLDSRVLWKALESTVPAARKLLIRKQQIKSRPGTEMEAPIAGLG